MRHLLCAVCLETLLALQPPSAFADEYRSTTASDTPDSLPPAVIELTDQNGQPIEFTTAVDSEGEPIIVSPEGDDLGLKVVLHPATGIPTLAPRESGEDIIEYAEGESSFTFYASNRGGIEVPPGYIYNPNLAPTGRHDYCTHSPDQFPSPGLNADFSGACARHDMCMDRADAAGIGYAACNNELWSDMGTVCSNVYTATDPRRAGCEAFRGTYWTVVTGAHLGNL